MKPLTSYQSAVISRFTPVFVSGSPRSGTTVCQALLCTSELVNDYTAESSYLTGMLNNFVTGLKNENHNIDFFGSKQDFIDFGVEEISSLMLHTWLRLETPKFLCLKDPLMYRHFDWLYQIYPNAKYIYTFRSPVETVSSRIKVDMKSGVQVDDERVAFHSRELLAYYEFAINLHRQQSQRLILINYDSI